MKKALLVVAVSFVLAANCFAAAAKAAPAAKKFDASIGGGVALPMGDFGDLSSMGFGACGRGLYQINPKVGIGAAFSYYMFSASDDAKAFFGDDLSIHTLEMLAVGKFTFGNGSAKPYGLVGVGLTSFGMSIAGYSASESDITLQPGLGVAIGSGSVALFIEGKFTYVMSEGSATTYIPFNVGAKF